MLELRSVSWKNFLSYGDKVETIELDQLGQCLITGEVISEDDRPKEKKSRWAETSQIRKSNGAGKSTIPNIIQWVLFGKTMHSASPGNNIVNWFTGKDCWGSILFKNGDSITRTRSTSGGNELFYSKDGEEMKFTSDTLSVASNQQNQINRIFGLDWEIFCGSVFFNQYGKPWMEMADATRKKAIERVLHVDRFTYYAQAAKCRSDNLDKLVEKYRNQIETHNNNITRWTAELERLKNASENFATNKAARSKQLLEQAASEVRKQQAVQLPDVEKLQAKWQIVKQVEAQIEKLRSDRNSHTTALATKEGKANALSQKIANWNSKAGKLCVSCEQAIPAEHTAAKISPIVSELEQVNSEITAAKAKIGNIKANIVKAEALLTERRPTMSVSEARAIHAQQEKYQNEAKRLKKESERALAEINPHSASIDDVAARIEKAKADITKVEEDMKRSELLNRHYNYTYKAYNDRTKIKSQIFKEHIPFINSRLKHYLEVFELDIKIELTDALGITSNMWGYNFESGGERKRTDVAFMLSMFDFHEQMYGRQSNILVLDEVDGRLDDDGIDALINIIKTDLAQRVESVLVISHRNLMHDTFPKEIRVIRKNRISSLEPILI